MAITLKIIGGGFIENNVSVQIGDEAWFVSTESTESLTNSDTNLSITHKIGIITEIGPGSITIESPFNIPGANDFLMFKKISTANDNSLLGYYAEVKLNNNSTEKAELFALNSEITVSSK